MESIIPYILKEVYELLDAVERHDMDDIRDEPGDLLFAAINLAGHLGISPETALREANNKFEQRFRYIQKNLEDEGQELECVLPETTDAL